MSANDVHAFIDTLRRAGELVTVEAEVDPRLEIAEIHRRVIAAGGPALLFLHPKGSGMPVVTNLFGTRRRAEMAFGSRPFRLVERLAGLAQELIPPSLGKVWRARKTVSALLRTGTRHAVSGPVSEILTRDPDITKLPALTCWPGDGGPFLTLPLVYTEPPDGGPSNLGMYRMQIFDARTTGMHWQIGKGGGFHYAAAERRGEPLPVTAFLGGPPALILAAIAPLPENVPELLLASMVLGRRLRTVSGPGPHPLIADAEIALTGHVPPHERRPEGPFGDHYGYYSLQHEFPVFHVEAMARRKDAIFPATVVGKPRQEDFFIGDLVQELLKPFFPLAMPAVRDLWSFGETGYHALSAAVVHERYPREAMAAAFRILGEGQLSLTKFLLATDQPVEVRDIRAVLEHILARTRPETDLSIFGNLAMDTLDYTGPALNRGSKGVWLGLGDPVRDLPRTFSAAAEPPGVTEIRVFCGGCLVTGGPAYADEPDAAARLARDPAFEGWPLIVLTDDAARTAASPMNFLWTTFTRFEPARDIHAASAVIDSNQIVRRPPVVIDARMKPSYPEELSCDPETAALVGRRWREYFPDGGVEMGDSNRASLT